MKTSYSIEAEHQGLSLRNFIKQHIIDLSTRAIESLLSQNGCLLNRSVQRFGSTKLRRGDQVEIFPQFLQTESQASIPILFEDEHLLIIDKPCGLTSSKIALEKALGQKLFLVHRLDKQTSGVLITAKTPQAQQKMEKLFFDRKIEKRYMALVHGKTESHSGTIEVPLKLKKRYEGGVIYQTAEYGKMAKTLWKKLLVSKDVSLLSLRPITGRTHQLRVHLASIDQPILGDPIYKLNATSQHMPRLMLHADRIVFDHPMTQARIEAKAPTPQVMKEQISKLFKTGKKCVF